ncbi:hypothetical protein BH23VER1_BH23VER1_22140 [soil metagenome]
MVTIPEGDDLAALLVREGLARSHGVARALSDGTPASEYKSYLDDLETGAALKKAGVWGATNPDAIADLRAQQRADDRRVDEAMKFGTFSNLDAATEEDLQQLNGIGPELASRIVVARPFHRVEDITKVNGIGPTTLAKIRNFLTVIPPAPAEPEG